MNQDDRVRLFDDWAAKYDETVSAERGFPLEGYQRVLAEIVRCADVRSGMAVLDVGIGTGNLALRFIERGCEIWGFDFSSKMLAKARAKLPEATLVQADVLGAWPRELNRRFDRIVSGYVLHEFDLAAKVTVLCRLVKDHLADGGQIVIGDVAFATGSDWAKAREFWRGQWEDDEFYWAADEAREVCARAGLELTYAQVSSCEGVFQIRAA